MKKKHQHFFLAATVIACAILIVVVVIVTRGQSGANGGSSGRVTVRIGYTPLMYAQPTFIALERGLFEDAGIDVEIQRFENSTQIVNSVIAGHLDFCAITPVLSVFAAEEKVDQDETLFKLYYYNLDSVEHPISFLLTPTDSTIRELPQLKGKTIGVFPGNILSRTAAKLLLKQYMDVETEIQFQDVGPQLQAQALSTGQIDAMFSLEPFATISLEKGVAQILHVAPQLSISKPLPGGCGMMSTEFVRMNPEAARRVFEVIEEAMEVLRSDPDFAKRVLLEYTPLTEDIALKVRQPQYRTAREMDGELLQREYDALRSEGILSKPMNTKRLVYDPGD